MRWAEISSGVVSNITVSDTEEFGAAWLNDNAGGAWVFVAEDVVVGPGYTYDPVTDLFVAPEVPDEAV
jgi:hypothetical protein